MEQIMKILIINQFYNFVRIGTFLLKLDAQFTENSLHASKTFLMKGINEVSSTLKFCMKSESSHIDRFI